MGDKRLSARTYKIILLRGWNAEMRKTNKDTIRKREIIIYCPTEKTWP